MPDERVDFFISYNGADRRWAEWIAYVLKEAGYSVIFQARDFRPSGNFVLDMQKAMEAADRTIAVLSPNYLSALYTQPEWAAAFAEDPTGEKGVLVPVRVRECELRGLWLAIHRIELLGLDRDAAKATLLAGVRRQRVEPDAEPAFPGEAPAPAPQEPRFPGVLPPIWNVPHLRNPNFTGREELLTRLEQALAAGPAAVTQAIHGLGGVGKTQLAIEYVYRHASDYDIVWWIRSEEPAKLAADYAALADPLDLPVEDAQDQRLIVEAVRRELEQRGRWLLVFDNARERGDVRDYLPRGGGGHVIVTSRDPNWRGVAATLGVPVWRREESVKFLLRRTGLDDEAAADALADALGDFPLALEHAAAYVERTGCSLADYLALFRDSRAALWEHAESPDDYHATVATTWELAFHRLRDEAPAAVHLLSLCAFLAPDDIPVGVLVEGAEHLPDRLAEAVTDRLSLNEAVADLRHYSLIESTGDALSVHRLVQAVTRDRLGDKEPLECAGATVWVAAAFPSDSELPETWDTCSRLLPHALAAAEHAEKLSVEPEAAGYVLNQIGLYLLGRAELAEAKRAFERALAIYAAAFGSGHEYVATTINNLGSVLKALGDLEGARAHFERALAIDKAAFGPEHPEVATDVNNLGSVLRAQGDLEAARAHFERALAIGEAAFGPEHPEVARDVNNLGSVLYDLGDLEGARAHFERALAIFEVVLGADHAHVATLVSNLGGVLHALGDLEGARAHFERALRIFRQLLGDDHPRTKAVRENLTVVEREIREKESE